jgi:hypothetical protein
MAWVLQFCRRVELVNDRDNAFGLVAALDFTPVGQELEGFELSHCGVVYALRERLAG